ncbi:MAG: U32 family peptidase, partial [Desulfofustis sp.]|nr:U32 family peptidase [Desulfofustis sp.]
MELLAPVGSLDHFGAAVEAGADGVYFGAPGFNARNPARELRFEEIRAMAAHCRTNGLTFYVALNSLVREEELPRLVSTLAELETIAPSALIVQDLGVIELAKRYFPTLTLHGSTLMFAHSSAGVEALATLGCSRVVLARELTIAEIERIIHKSSVEIEIFIHGAMCFSYSGGCLFSSYHGGKSGLRGNCVQPCRRKYTVTSTAAKKKKGPARAAYYFSMNDLEGIDLVEEFNRIGVSSLKIEGRLRSVNYVEQVVRAYRMVMDARPEERDETRAEAKKLVTSALGRKSSTGFFLGERSKGIIAPHHSGNIGTYCGRISTIDNEGTSCWGHIRTKHQPVKGDRFRLHDEKSGERVGFTLKDFDKTGSEEYRILLPQKLKPGTARNILS